MTKLAEELETLVCHAYPMAAEDMVTTLTWDYFVDALQDWELQLYVKKPTETQVYGGGTGFCGSCWGCVAYSTFKDIVQVGNKAKLDIDIVQGPRESVTQHWVSEEVLPLYISKIKDPCCLLGLESLDYLIKVGACVNLWNQKLIILGDKVPLSLGADLTVVTTVGQVHLAPETQSRVPSKSAKKTAGKEGAKEYSGPLEQANSCRKSTYQKE
ncbi:hypothetical protein E2C01_048346 [Portunus trituberculatus]|uniref:Uncharacterized protein n=1 Tax=Portunus trituberculatus TaxID=210409 RepID=A0A5B7G2X3_PORTR|nr:hypothetical protein [Portunus trituberculatus]